MPDQGIDVLTLWLSKLRWLTTKAKMLEDRISVLETCTQNYESRLEDLETWQDKVNDKLED